jgi:predicted acetyltransferase
MVRVVEPVRALESLDYPDRDERVVLDVSDPVFGDGDPVVLAVTDGTATVDRDPDATPGVRCSVAALSQVTVGYRSVETLREITDLSGDPDALDRLDRLFPPAPVYLADYF